jgi:surfactin synthase thioesterase subunit
LSITLLAPNDGCMTLDKWIPFRNEGPAARCRLFCFPHAGGNAAFYRPLRHLMPPEVDFCPVELPGRAARLEEPPCTSMSALMERLGRALQPLLRADLALVAGYVVGPGDRIACPITAFAGADDVTHHGSLEAWSDFTRGKFRTCIFPGGHFYFSPAGAALAGEIIEDLHASVGMPAPDARP